MKLKTDLQHLETHTEMEPQELGVDFCVWTKISSDLSDSIAKPHIARIQDHKPVFSERFFSLAVSANEPIRLI